jgi:hypothetical protein
MAVAIRYVGSNIHTHFFTMFSHTFFHNVFTRCIRPRYLTTAARAPAADQDRLTVEGQEVGEAGLHEQARLHHGADGKEALCHPHLHGERHKSNVNYLSYKPGSGTANLKCKSVIVARVAAAQAWSAWLAAIHS